MNIIIQPYKHNPQMDKVLDRLFLELQKYEHQFDPNKSTRLKSAIKYKNRILKEVEEKKWGGAYSFC